MDRNQPNTAWSVAAYRLWSTAAISWMSWPMSYAKMAKQLAGGSKIGDKSGSTSVSKAASAAAPPREPAREVRTAPAAVAPVAQKPTPDTGGTRVQNSASSAPSPSARAAEMPERQIPREAQSAAVHASPAKEAVAPAPSMSQGKADKKRKHHPKASHAHRGSNGKSKNK
jgi:hypothetical protein